jgi:hypothetical protein
MFRQRLAGLAVLAAAPFLLLACSSGGSKSDGAKLPDTPGVNQPATSGASDAGDSDGSDDSTSGSEATDGSDGSDGSGGDAAAFCKVIDYPDYLMGETGGEDVSSDQLATKLQEIRDAAPDDIKGAVSTIADVDLAISQKGSDDPEVARKMMSPEFRQATTDYGNWKKQNCPED